MATADELKAQGNKAFSAKDYDNAIALFSKALELDPQNFVLWSNRSAAKTGKRDWAGALEDAEQVRAIITFRRCGVCNVLPCACHDLNKEHSC